MASVSGIWAIAPADQKRAEPRVRLRKSVAQEAQQRKKVERKPGIHGKTEKMWLKNLQDPTRESQNKTHFTLRKRKKTPATSTKAKVTPLDLLQ